MNKEIPPPVKLAGVTVAIFILISLSIDTTSGLHVHDTYIIMGFTTKMIVSLTFAVFVVSLLVSILSKFKNKLYLRMLVFSTLLLFSASIYIFSFFFKPH